MSEVVTDRGQARSAGASWLDAAGGAPAVVCQLTDGCCLRMSPSAYWLFGEIEKGRSYPEIRVVIKERFGQDLDAEVIEAAGTVLLADIDAQLEKAQQRRRRRYAFRVRLLPESVVARIVRRLEFLFSWPVAVLYAVVLVTGGIALFASGAPRAVGEHLSSPGGLVAAYVVYLGALLAHELGHGTACSRYRMRPGDIGFAVYLVFPAVYCDVTRAWLLPRRQRVVVDLSGLLFEVGVGALYATLGSLLHAWILTLAALLVLGNLVWALNPFGRFDMYWTLSDALGLVDLSSARWRILRDLVRPGRRRPDSEHAALGRAGRSVLLSYGMASLALFAFFGYGIVEVVGSEQARAGAEFARLGHLAAHGDVLGVLSGGFGLFFPILISVVMGGRLLISLIVPLVRRIRLGGSAVTPTERT